MSVIAHTLRGEGFAASEDGTGRGTPLVAATLNSGGNNGGFRTEPGEHLVATYSIQERAVSENPDSGPQGKGWQPDIGYTLEARHHQQAVAFAQNQRDELRTMEVAGALAAEPGMKQQTYAKTSMGVRRLMPIECERLQSFPDHWTRYGANGEEMSDSARYRMLGNAVCVNVAHWIGTRIMATNPPL